MCIGVGWRSGTRLRRNVSQIIPNSNGQVGGPGPGPVVLSARCRACRGMKSIKAPVFEGRNRSPNPSFGSLPLVLLLSLRHASRAPRLFHPRVSVGETRVAHTMEGAGMGEKGGIQSPFSTDERGNRPTPFFSLSRFLFFSSFLILLLVPCIICFFLRPLFFSSHPSREKKSSSSKDEKVYSYPLDAISFCSLFFRGGFRGFFFFLTFSCLYPFDDEGCFFNLLRLFSFLHVPLSFLSLAAVSFLLSIPHLRSFFSTSTSSQFILSFLQLLAFSKEIARSSSLHTCFLILLYSHFLFSPFL